MYLPLKARLFLLTAILPMYAFSQVTKQQRHIDSLIAEIPKQVNDTARIMLLQNIAYAYSEINPDKGLNYAGEAIKISGTVNDKKWLASSIGMLALVYNAKTEYKTAISYNEKALAIYKKLKNRKSAAAIYANLSLIYLGQSNYSQALKNGFEALKIYEESHADKNTAIVLENIGHIYFEQKDYSRTQDYYTRALKIYKKFGVNTDIARTIGNLARVFQAKNDYDTALEYLFRALKSNEESGLENSIQNNLANIGNVYLKLKDYPKAIKYTVKALALSQKMGVRSDIAVNHGNLGSIYLEMEKNNGKASDGETFLPLAIANLKESVKICKEIGFLAPMAEFNQSLIEAYQLNGNYKEAFQLLQQNVTLKDAVFSLQSKIELSDLGTKREIELKNKDIIIKKTQLKLREAEKANERIVYLSGIFLLCSVIFLLFRFFQRRARSHKSEMANIIHIQAHTVRGPVASILGLAQLLNSTKPDDPMNTEILDGIYKIAVDLDKVILDVISKHHSQP
jgi:tetratricopeptide (TPR) repeat protein